MGIVAEIDPLGTVVNQVKGYFPIHLACQFSMVRLIQLLMQQPGMNIEQPDYNGNTPLHHACMSAQRGNALVVVKMLLNDYGANILAKNSQGQMPYDLASLDSVRQFLLPIQLQKETQIALDNGGLGLPPGIDLGGLRIQNSAVPPPPKFGEGGILPPNGGALSMMASPNQQRYAATPNYASPQQYPAPIVPAPAPASGPYVPSPSPAPRQPIAPVSGSTTPFTPPAIPAASRVRSATTSTGSIASTESGYSRSGGSSAAVFSTKYRADGFHSSSSDVSLQKKYGHLNASNVAVPPPPSSGNAAPLSSGVPNVPGTNPFAGGYRAGSRYIAYGPGAAAPASGPSYSSPYGNAAAPAPQYFTPNVATPAPTETQPSTVTSPAAPTTPFMPPPPYQTQNYAAPVSSPAPAATPTVSTAASAAAAFETPHPSIPAAATTTAEATAKAFEQPPEDDTATSQPQAVADAEPSTATSDWIETVDPSTGQSYYYNAKTNETSWTKPEEMRDGREETPTGDWTEATDPSSGKTYYYNTKTGETSWEKPVAMETVVAEPNSASAEASPEEMSKEEEGNDADAAPVEQTTTELGEAKDSEQKELKVEPQLEEELSNQDTLEPAVVGESDAVEKKENEQSDDVPQKNAIDKGQGETNIESTEEPTELDPQEESTTKEAESEQSSAVVVTRSESSTLPDDWVEVPDPSSGKSYYYNSKTQETSWEKPRVVTNDGGAAQPNETLAVGWVEVQDPSSGRSYYFNQTTNETSWEKPLAQTDSTSNGASDWIETTDPSTGMSYYYNSKTGETSWEKPAALTVAENEDPVPVTIPEDATPATPHRETVERQKSAEELFSDGPPATADDKQQAATPDPSASTQTDLATSEAATFESQETTVISGGIEPAEKVSGSPSATTYSSTALSAEAILEAVSTDTPEAPASATNETHAEPNSSNGLNESNDTEGEMMDVPLSPEPVSIPAPFPKEDSDAASKPTDASTFVNTSATSIPIDTNDLFAAIGMPPPPFQSKR